MTSLQHLLEEVRSLKPIPAVANQLLEVVDDPGSSMEDIARVIQYDPVMTANVLRTCNSAYFGLKHPAESIKDAVNLLGTDQVIELVLLKSGAGTFSGRQDGYGLEEGEMWRYSVSTAVIAKQIALRLKLANKNTLFTSALVKDMGKIILEKYVSRSLDRIKHLVESDRLSFREAEKKALGIDHAELGAMIAKMWKFSPKMVKIIRHHHLADETMIKDKDIAVVYLADCITMMIGMGVGSDGLSYRFKDEAIRELGLNADDVAMVIAEFAGNMQEIENLLKIV
ncbi:MAG: HDOD domain-containing protein [Desulfobacula sp.]|jgi:putative nucleotidyltransferase with HDIG domain